MVNPFEKRATEYLRDDEAFLAVVTPEPLGRFFGKPASEGRLYDRLTMVIGTPGSGKTTLARLFEFKTLQTLLRNRALDSYKPLLDSLTSCGAIEDERPTLVGCRISLETEYREFWEFPYPEELRTSLMIALLQARTVLAWLRNIEATGVKLEDVKIAPRADAEAALTAIGGVNAKDVHARARDVEYAIYRISAALVPPKIEDIEDAVSAAYRPFDVIEGITINQQDGTLNLRPLVIFDDAHSLSPTQVIALQRWLTKRELKVARWILTRLDSLRPADVLLDQGGVDGEAEPGVKRAREITDIWMQGGEDRAAERRAFRKMAKDMAGRYLSQMEIFNRRRLTSLGALLSTEPEPIAPSKRERLASQVDVLQRKLAISGERRRALEEDVALELEGSVDDNEDVSLAMLAILLERYAKRVPQRALFEESEEGSEPTRAVTTSSGVVEGARLHLMHKHDRPFYYGIDTLCDASSENAEQFLQLAARLVSQSQTQAIRAKPAMLSSGVQHTQLRSRAAEMVRSWDFPHHQLVRRLAEGIAAECLAKSLEGNASLGGGANGFGIPQDEFETIPDKHPELARVLQFGIAYNAFVLVPNHSTKNRLWCLVELGGVLLLNHGLTLKRGGFLERGTADLAKLLRGGARG